MSLSKQLERLRERREKRLSGKHFAVPFEGLSKISDQIVGFEPKTLYAVTAETGVGKTKYTLQLLRAAFKASKKHNIPFRVLYFMLEGDRHQLADRLMSLLLAEQDIYIGTKVLSSTKKVLPEEILTELEQIQEEYDWIMERMIVVDDEYNPTGIYKTARHYGTRWGLEMEQTSQKTFFKPKEGDVNLIVIDHINLFNNERDPDTKQFLSKYGTIQRWVSHYCLKYIIKQWHFGVLNIVQQAASGDRNHTNTRGNVILSKVEPSIDGFGNNKEIARDHDVILGLFNPHKYDLPSYGYYNLNQLRRTLRSVKILKNRDGDDYAKILMLFEGASGLFEEIPTGKASDEKVQAVYARANHFVQHRIS